MLERGREVSRSARLGDHPGHKAQACPQVLPEPKRSARSAPKTPKPARERSENDKDPEATCGPGLEVRGGTAGRGRTASTWRGISGVYGARGARGTGQNPDVREIERSYHESHGKLSHALVVGSDSSKSNTNI